MWRVGDGVIVEPESMELGQIGKYERWHLDHYSVVIRVFDLS